MPNNNAFKPVVHEKKILKGFCFFNLYKHIFSKSLATNDPSDFICTNVNLLSLRMFHDKY